MSSRRIRSDLRQAQLSVVWIFYFLLGFLFFRRRSPDVFCAVSIVPFLLWKFVWAVEAAVVLIVWEENGQRKELVEEEAGTWMILLMDA